MNNDEYCLCPNCEGEDESCMYCDGSGKVTANAAAEWKRQNEENAKP